MVLGGLWHGASWNFIIWGAIHGGALVVQRLLSKTFDSSKFPISSNPLLKPLSIAVTFATVCLAWIFFRASNLEDALYIISKIFDISEYNLSGITNKFHVLKGMMLILFLVVVEVMVAPP